MAVKRIGNKRNIKARKCLNCGKALTGLKDNVINTCKTCGQQHLVDVYINNTLALTVAERPEMRRRHKNNKKKQERPKGQEYIDFSFKLLGFRQRTKLERAKK